MKKRQYLTPQEVDFLGLNHNKIQKGKNKERHVISDEDYESILEFRNNHTVESEEQINKSNTPFDLTAWTSDGKIMNIDDFCKHHNLNRGDIKSWRLCTHTKVPTYNITFKENIEAVDEFDYLGELKKKLKKIKPVFKLKQQDNKRQGVVSLTDFHFGAYISALNITPEFNIDILCKMLNQASERINRFNYSVVHIHLLGDLIESFTGLNHKNSWKGLDKGMYGVKAIKLFVKLFIEHFLNNVNNLGDIKIVAGNHDRVTSDKSEDSDGGAAELIAWGLENKGYNVEFNRAVITHKVDNVNHILAHGHLLMMMKKSTQELCWMYGEKGCFNYIKEGHLHSRIRKLNANKVSNFKMVSDDSIDCRRETISSLFTGNPYSEDGGWSTLAGFSISEQNINGNGVDVYDISL